MAMKIPCVISQLANNAIGAPNDCVCIAEQPEHYAAHINHLLNHPDKAREMAERAYTFVKLNFDWEASTIKINELL